MSFESPGALAPEEQPCRYGASRLYCRGPSRGLDNPYLAFLGGNETFGKFVRDPFVALLEQRLGRTCVNLGSMNAGLDAFVQDRDLIGIAQKAKLCVIQVMGAQNLSNRLYRVHPRRNDRFLAPSQVLRSVYGEVDFSDINFNKHLLCTLHQTSVARFDVVRDELRRVWLSRMRLLLESVGKQAVLLWLRYRPDQGDDTTVRLGSKPLLVDPKMVGSLGPLVRGVVEIDVNTAHETGEIADMPCGSMQVPAAGQLIGPTTHRLIAERLERELAAFL